ncbi:MAG: CDP-alcohol phosphatidyltransferase family protein [Clostridia bacterium]|nr:CDP-alcohol phosphatidyltransferase family protein [Clostridia bacterium]
MYEIYKWVYAMKHLPNIITLTRIASALLLLPVQAFSQAFFLIYTYCGISDILDGALARKLRCNNESGAKLDSVADIVFYAVAAYKIFPVLCSELTPLIWCIIAAAALIRIISYAAAAVKYRCFASLHTYMNKLTGFLVFSVAYIIFLPFAKQYCMIISITAVIAALEELLIHISTNEYNADRRTLLMLTE